MAIVDRQRRQTEVGRIRLGQKTTTKNGKTAPTRLETFRFTSPSKPLIEQIAKLYGGDVQPWTPPRGAAQWEVVTDTASVPVVVPPQDIDSSQFYELWTAGGCQRRCTGVRELLADQDCVCNPADRECKLHTRVNLMLRDVTGIGVWRLDTGGYYAAVELPGMVDLLARAAGLVPALLELQQRTITREGKTNHFVVPVLHVEDFTPGQLIAGQIPGVAIGGTQERAALPAGPANGNGKPTVASLRAALSLARDPKTVRVLWDQAKAAGIRDEALAAEMKARGELLAKRAAAGDITPDQVIAGQIQPVDGEVEPDRTETWTAILAAAGIEGWNTAQTSQAVRDYTGKSPEQCDGFELAAFLDALRGGRVTT